MFIRKYIYFFFFFWKTGSLCNNSVYVKLVGAVDKDAVHAIDVACEI
jgi:hypothetical protein